VAEGSSPRSGEMPALWYFADNGGQIGPLSIHELKDTIAKLPNPADVLVWANEVD
jgi:GYF domain 2